VPSQLPKAKRVGGGDRRALYVLIGIAAVLVIAVAYVLFSSSSLFNPAPKSAAERDYQALLLGLKLHPNDPAVLMTLAEKEFELGKKGDALAHGARASDLATSTIGISVRFAQILLQDNKPSDAKKYVDRELKIDSKTFRAEPHYLLAQILYQQGKKTEAIKEMEKTLSADYTAADMKIVYADMLAGVGRKADAIRAYKDALRYLPNDKRALEGLAKLGVAVGLTPTPPNPHAQAATSTPSGK
jgi:predicted Zn-dependent protease